MPKGKIASPSAAADIPWSQRPVLSLKDAAKIAGISVSSLYRYEAAGRLAFGRLGGRTLVQTESLIRLIDSIEPWSASDQGAAARAKRSERAREAWA